ncbi:heme ABC transporter permease CcmC [Leptolyngbya sp. 15MV]|nr:heme ABC transporter permease CcmC [Leptolyngbya sp. 15MV]
MSLFLARAGLRVRVLERHAAPFEDPRAATIHPPTMEMFSACGVTADLLAAGIRAPVWQFRGRAEGIVAEFDLSILADVTPFPFRLQCEQHKLCRILLAHLARHTRAEVQWGVEVNGAVQDAEGVTLTAAGGARHRARYAIGADGGRSVLRKSQDIGFEGFTYPERFLVVTTTEDMGAKGYAISSYVSDPVTWCAMFKVPANGPPGLWRIVFPTDPAAPEADLLDFARARERLRALIPEQGAFGIVHTNLYAVHQRVATRFRKGRVLLAGDAAHVNNPLGGMGMNFGIHDAILAAERIAAVLAGGDDDLLDRYDRQRRHVAEAFLQAMTIANKQTLEEKDAAKRAPRLAEPEPPLLSRLPRRLSARARPPYAQAADAARIHLQDTELQPRSVADQLAPRRHASGQREHQPAHGIDIRLALLLRQHGAEPRLEGFDSGAGIQLHRAVRALDDRRARHLVVLVADVADDRLHQVLDGDEAIDAAVFVHHQRHVDALRAHLQQQVQHGDGRHHQQRLPQDRLQRERRRVAADRGEPILDVHHADDLIEVAAIHRQPAVPLPLDQPDRLIEREILLDRDDVGARHHHVIRGLVAQPQHIAEQDALMRIEAARRHLVPSRLLIGVAIAFQQLLHAVPHAFRLALPHQALKLPQQAVPAFALAAHAAAPFHGLGRPSRRITRASARSIRRAAPAASWSCPARCSAHQRELLESGIRLDGREGHRLRQRAHRLHVHADPMAFRVARLDGRVRIGLADHLHDPDDLLPDVGMIEEGEIAEPHRLQVGARHMVAHPGPGLDTPFHLLVPGKGVGLGFHQPVLARTLRHGQHLTRAAAASNAGDGFEGARDGPTLSSVDASTSAPAGPRSDAPTRSLHRFANPGRFLRLTGAWMPWLWALALGVTAAGAYWALVVSPTDWQQGETVRIMYVHVPMAWLAMGGYVGLGILSLMSLIWRHPLADLTARELSPVGAAVTALCLATGSLWGKPMWGTWWVWDARLTSVLVLFFLWLGHAALVRAFDEPERGARAGAILALVGIINVPIVKFSVDWWNTLHHHFTAVC